MLRKKLYHYAGKVREDGAISALCYTTPHPINLKRSSWTLSEDYVTCPRCRKTLREAALRRQPNVA